MAGFWLVAGAMIVIALALVLPRLSRRASSVAGSSRTDANAAILRDRLHELDAELASGVLSASQHAHAREELQRRVLEESEQDSPSGGLSPFVQRATVGVLAAALPVAAVGLYLVFGSPALLREQPSGDIVAAAVAEGDLSRVRAELEVHLKRHPRDGRAWVILARLEFAEDRFDAAAAAYERALDTSTKVARDPTVWCELADALGMAQGGSLEGRPRELVERALALKADHPKALEMAGSAAYERREYVEAARYWRMLLAQIPEGSEAHRQLAAAISRSDRLAGG